MSEAPELRLTTHAVLRVAAWPVEAAADFGSAALAAAARELLAETARRRRAGEELAERVFAAVPDIEDAAERRWLITVRRALHGGVEPYAPAPPPALPAAPSSDPASPAGTSGLDAPAVEALLVSLEAERVARAQLAARRAEVDRLVDATLLDELVALRQRAGAPSFRIALGLANAAVAEKWERLLDRTGAPVVAPKARVRRLEGTVLHYFLRACGRPTPHGTFAGIVPVTPDEDTGARLRVGPGEPAVRVEPDLEPFVDALARWRAELVAWPAHVLRRNPTLHTADGVSWWQPWGAPAWVSGVVPPELLAVMDRWAPGTEHRRDAFGADVPPAHVDAALASGLLESTIILDADAVDGWTALRAAADRLPDDRRRLLIEVIDDAARQCDALAAAIRADDVAAVRAGSAALVDVVGRLGSDAPGVPRVDARLPRQATWDAPARAAAERAIRRVLWLHHHDGAAEAYRRARLGQLVGADDGEEGPVARSLLHLAATRSTAAAPTVPGAIRSAALADVGVTDPTEPRWTSLLLGAGGAAGEPVPLAVRLDAGPPPGSGRIGAAVLTASGASWWYRWGRPQPGMLQTRFASLLPDGSPVELHEGACDVDAVVIVGAAHPNPTVAVHDRAVGRTMGRAGAAAAAIDGDGWRVVRDGDSAHLLLDAGSDGGSAPRCPVYDSVAAVSTTDPLGRYLGALAMAQGWELLVYGAPPMVADELTGARVPRVVLGDAGPTAVSGVTVAATAVDGPDVTVVSPRRWTIGLDEIERLRASAGAEQYLAWRALADARGIDDLVLVRWSPVPGSAEYLWPTTSPLALRSLFDHLAPEGGPLVASELPGPVEDWPVQTADGHHLSELAVTWWRDPGSASTDPS